MLHQLCYKLAYNQREVNLDKYGQISFKITIIVFWHHSSHDRILKFLAAYDKPIRKIQEEFRPMSSKIVQALVPLLPSYMKVRNTTGLRNEAILSIIAKPQKLTAPISLKVTFSRLHALHVLKCWHLCRPCRIWPWLAKCTCGSCLECSFHPRTWSTKAQWTWLNSCCLKARTHLSSATSPRFCTWTMNTCSTITRARPSSWANWSRFSSTYPCHKMWRDLTSC